MENSMEPEDLPGLVVCLMLTEEERNLVTKLYMDMIPNPMLPEELYGLLNSVRKN